MKYTVYKTTNNQNNKVYIGKHQTINPYDDYLGSGIHISAAITKYGRENFTKEILYIFDTEKEMNDKEAELVTEEFCKDDFNYNLCPGGKGGWGYLNSNGLNTSELQKQASGKVLFRYNKTEKARLISSENLKKLHKDGVITNNKSFLGKKHTKEAKMKIGKANSKHQSGSGNSQFGKMWITNGSKNMKINQLDIIPEGWNKGRKMN